MSEIGYIQTSGNIHSAGVPLTLTIHCEAVASARTGQLWDIGPFRYQVMTVDYVQGLIYLEHRP